MEAVKPYHRALYRIPASYPAMYCVTSVVGEGMVTDLSAIGCSLQTDEPLKENQHLALRLLLPDRPDSLAIELGRVRWVREDRAGIEFTQVDRAANLRLHSFVWNQMVERIHLLHVGRLTP